MKKLILSLAVLAISSGAYASSLDECYSKADTNVEMQSCAQDDLDSANSAMTAEYKKLETLFDAKTDDGKESLRRLAASQDAWLAFREANCQFAGAALLGGSGEGLVVLSCHDDLTKKRVAELKHFEDEFRGR